VLQGEATRRVTPTYPALARAARVSGAVVVEITIDENGNVISARPISGHPLLKDAATQAARGWKFNPTKLSGQPVKVIGTIQFNFTP
jgi:protein TonB